MKSIFSNKAVKLPDQGRTPLDNNPVEKRPKKLFVSYSHEDETEWKDKIGRHLASLRNQELIDDWHDRKIEPGLWETQIEEALERADVYLLLITSNFIASDYINTREIKTAYRRYKEGKAVIFPIICDACDWTLLPVTKEEREFNESANREMYVWLGKFQAFPKDARPIKNWPNSQDGFLDVITQLKKYLLKQ